MSTAFPSLNQKALLIINPVAGRKTIQRSICGVIRCLMDGGYLVTTAVTGARNDARTLCASIGADYDLIVCAGGDGTLNECISGMADAELRRPVGYIPCGSTNDFALSNGLPAEASVAAAAISKGRLRQYDIGCFGSAIFCTTPFLEPLPTLPIPRISPRKISSASAPMCWTHSNSCQACTLIPCVFWQTV